MRLELKSGVTLYLARHGETQANREHRFSGRRDTPLTQKGLREAHAVGEIMKREVGTRPGLDFVSSPLKRAQLTMEIVRGVLGLEKDGYCIDPRIAEIDLGEWDELTDEEARARDPAYFEARGNDKWNIRVPGGENYEQVAVRASAWVRDIKADTFAVSHGALTRILRGLFGGMDWHAMSALDEPQGVVFRIRGSEVVRLDP